MKKDRPKIKCLEQTYTFHIERIIEEESNIYKEVNISIPCLPGEYLIDGSYYLHTSDKWYINTSKECSRFFTSYPKCFSNKEIEAIEVLSKFKEFRKTKLYKDYCDYIFYKECLWIGWKVSYSSHKFLKDLD